MKYGAIQAGSWRYPLTDRDVLWAGRMVQGETNARAGRADDALAVLWTMTQLFSPAGQRDKYGRQRFGDFTSLIRAYSQPINPLWLGDGLFCRPGGRAAGTEACAVDRLARRARLQQTPWRELDVELRQVVLDWAAGRTDNPVPGAVEFAAESVAASFLARNPAAVRVARIHNTFVATEGSRGWPVLPVIRATARRAALPVGVALIAAAVGASLTWAYHRFSSSYSSSSSSQAPGPTSPVSVLPP
ncbi:MAG: hypothetical protein H6710_00005 [Myxococcales bacterium]|nr:hypothetical protein [Myxococcales bacterium]